MREEAARKTNPVRRALIAQILFLSSLSLAVWPRSDQGERRQHPLNQNIVTGLIFLKTSDGRPSACTRCCDVFKDGLQ